MLRAILFTIAYFVLFGGVDVAAALALDRFLGAEYSSQSTIPVAIISLFLYFFVIRPPNISKKEKSEFTLLSISLVVILAFTVVVTTLLFQHLHIILGKGVMSQIDPNFNPWNIELRYHILYLLKVVLLIPILEELFFREYLISILKRHASVGLTTMVLTSGFLFGLIHLSWIDFNESVEVAFGACTLGCFSAYIYLLSGRILYSIVMHICSNLFFYFLRVFPHKYQNTLSFLDFGFYYWALIITTFFTSILLARYIGRVCNARKSAIVDTPG